MADICQFVCSYRTPSGFCGSTGGYATCQHRKMDEPPTIKSAEPIKPMTNADKYFRNATDEEIASFLAAVNNHRQWSEQTLMQDLDADYAYYLDWLKQEVDD